MPEFTTEGYIRKLKQIIDRAENARLVVSADRQNVFVDYGPDSYERWVVIGSNAAVPIDHDVAAALSLSVPLISVSGYTPPTPEASLAAIHTFIKMKHSGVHIRPVGRNQVYLGENDPKLIGQHDLQLTSEPGLIRLGRVGYPIRLVARPSGVIRLVLNPAGVTALPK